MTPQVVTSEAFQEDVDGEMDRTIDQHTVLHIHRGEGRDVVLLSAEDWQAISETLYLNQQPGLVDSLHEAAKEPLDQGTLLKDLEW